MKVFIESDKDQEITYNVCRSSIITRNSLASVAPINLDNLKDSTVYKRNDDIPTLIKFFVPLMSDYTGWALYCKDTMIFLNNIKELFSLGDNPFSDSRYAVMIVKHENANNNNSLILWNCSHPSNSVLTEEFLNSVDDLQSLENFFWLKPSEIGILNHEWNWLVGTYSQTDPGQPQAIEFPNGGPWQEEFQSIEYGLFWEREKNEYIKNSISPRTPHRFENLPAEINTIIDMMIKYRADSNNEYYNVTKGDIIKEIETNLSPKRVFSVEEKEDQINLKKGLIYDPFLENFIIGAGGQITTWNTVEHDKSPVVIRGIAKRKQIYSCWQHNRDFYYIDTGYFGNGKKKLYHRITKNHLQNIYPVVTRPRDRLSATGWRPCKFRGGSNILICPPSAKVMKFFDLDLDQWMQETLTTIKQHTDRPIVIRMKQSRSSRINDDSLAMALSRDVHCLVTFNSIAATEALLLGKPAITLGPNAAQALCRQDLSHINNPYIPTLDEVEEWAAHLAYSQFTELEMRNGYAWSILNEISNISSSDTKEQE